MISGTNEPTDLTICVPLSAGDRAQAQTFAQQQLASDKAERVYRNTLAVLAVNTYLQWQQIQYCFEKQATVGVQSIFFMKMQQI